jgi:hypothetical protein
VRLRDWAGTVVITCVVGLAAIAGPLTAVLLALGVGAGVALIAVDVVRGRHRVALDVERVSGWGVEKFPHIEKWRVIRIRHLRITNRSTKDPVSLRIELSVVNPARSVRIAADDLHGHLSAMRSLYDQDGTERPEWLRDLPTWITDAVSGPIDIQPGRSEVVDLDFVWMTYVIPEIKIDELSFVSDSTLTLEILDHVSHGQLTIPITNAVVTKG